MEAEYEVMECTSVNKNSNVVTLGNGITFRLYNGEIRRLGIRQGVILSVDILDEIELILYKRGISRALYLIKDRDYTVCDLKKKLTDGCYPEQIILKIVERLSEEGFLNDLRYAINYIYSRSSRRSRKQIVFELLKKGIGNDTIQAAFNDYEQSNDCEQVEKDSITGYIDKKLRGRQVITYNDYNKVLSYLLRKGYEYQTVRNCLELYVKVQDVEVVNQQHT